MTTTKQAAITLVALTVLLACSSMDIRTDYDPAADFGGLRRYAWLPRPEPSDADPRVESDLLHGRIVRNVDAVLSERGYQLGAAGEADFLVGYHVGVRDQLEVRTLNSHYGYGPGWGWGYYGDPGGPGTETYTYQYELGSLILDIVKPGSKELIWRGSAEAEMNESASPEQRDETIREAVTKMLDRFPPGRVAS